MLDTVTAVRFDRRMSSGKTLPCLLSCQRTDSTEVELVAKFSGGCERQAGALIAEALSAMLASDLDIPVPEPFLVEFDRDFAEVIRSHDAEVGERALRSVSTAFGSKKLPSGFALLPTSKAIPHSLREQAGEIFAFDALIQNSDRRPGNPNCLFDGRNFACLDHELAFITKGLIGWRPPWYTGGLESWRTPYRHIFFSQLKGKPPNFSRLQGAWEAVSDVRLKEYHAALPVSWTYGSDAVADALDYIAEVRNNISSALGEVTRILQ